MQQSAGEFAFWDNAVSKRAIIAILIRSEPQKRLRLALLPFFNHITVLTTAHGNQPDEESTNGMIHHLRYHCATQDKIPEFSDKYAI